MNVTFTFSELIIIVPLYDQNIDDCLTGICENGGTCIDEAGGYHCNCVEGFGGVHCQNDLDECASNPCENEATCSDYVNR